MASQSDVQNQLVAQIAGLIYPNGTSQPSICGMPVKIYPGWPVPNVLETDLRAGKVHISVYPGNTERKTTRSLGRPWVQAAAPAYTATMTVSGLSISLGGTVSRQNLAVNVDGKTYVYAMQATDTLAGAAAGLATLIPHASSTGPVITLTSAHSVWARVGGFGSAYTETKRQEKQFQIIVWAPTPAARNAASDALDSALSASTDMPMTDGSPAIIRYSHSFQSDQVEKAGLYRGDLFYSIDYATIQTQSAPEVIAPVINTTALAGQAASTLNP